MIIRTPRRGVAVGALVLGLLAAGVGTAHAGGNGQQINYYSHDATGQCTSGRNQNGVAVRNCTTFDRIGGNPDQGYFWVGPVTITWMRKAGFTQHSTCVVPKQQPSDFFTCYQPK
ncbi:hypothetical protein BKA01_005021 [Pseudonocardia eucalypti]|nr:hypothetical protein [Pseudonocardia eucalypti]